MAHRRAGQHRPAMGQPLPGLGQAHRHMGAVPPQQPGHLAGDGIAFVQHHRHAAPARRQDRRRRDVTTAAEDRRHPAAANQGPRHPRGVEQLRQIPNLAQTSALQPAGPHRMQWIGGRHQLPFHAVGNPQPFHLPIGRQGFRHRQGWKEVATRAAGGNQEGWHGRWARARLT